MYQAGSWDYPWRVAFKIEKPYGQLTHKYTFIVTNMDMEPYQTIHLKLIKIAARAVRSARYITVKLYNSCPYKKEFYKILENIQCLNVQLE